MATKKLLAIPIGPDPKGWSDIRSAWSRHQVANQGTSEMETLRDFVVTSLTSLEKKPDHLSPEAYARFFDTMSALVPWRKFHTYMQEVRLPIMISLGVLAQRSDTEKSKNGRSIPAQYMFQMKQAFDHMRFKSSIDTHMHEDMHQFLESQLLPLYKLRLLKEFTSPDVWLNPTLVAMIKELLPTKEQEAFKFFAWDGSNPPANKELVRVFLPSVYTLLDLSLADTAWNNWATVAKALKGIGSPKKNKTNSVAFELPSDCFD